MKTGMDGGVLFGRSRPGRGCSAIYVWMDVVITDRPNISVVNANFEIAPI